MRNRNFVKRFLAPFWFSKSCDYIKVPYVYNWCIIVIIISAFIQFSVMAWHGRPAAVLAAYSGVIGMFVGLYLGIIAYYEKSKDNKK